MPLSAADQTWLNWLLITSQPLRRYDASEAPQEFGSGALVEYRQRRFLLTVAHAVKLDQSDWVMDTGPLPRVGLGHETYRPFAFFYGGEANRAMGDNRMLDFCFAEIAPDLKSYYQHRTPFKSDPKRLRHVFDANHTAMPDAESVYGFAGEIKQTQLAPGNYCIDMVAYPGLKYLRTENEMHVFKLPVEHPGHDEFRGCSGSPIVDMQKRVVALVCKGDEEHGLIYGISLNHCKVYLDWYCNTKDKE
jgi:hypothetical protein